MTNQSKETAATLYLKYKDLAQQYKKMSIDSISFDLDASNEYHKQAQAYQSLATVAYNKLKKVSFEEQTAKKIAINQDIKLFMGRYFGKNLTPKDALNHIQQSISNFFKR